MRNAYIRAVSLQTGFAWPFFAAFGAALLPVVRLLYGDQWDASVPIAEALIFWAALVATFSYGGHALLSVGCLNLNLAQASISLAARFGAVLYAVQYGLQSIAVAFIAVGVLELVITTWFLYIAIGMTPLDLLRACTRSALVASLPLTACHGLAPAIYANISLEFFQVVAFGTLGMSCWLLGLYLFKHPLRLELHRVWDKGNELVTSIRSR